MVQNAAMTSTARSHEFQRVVSSVVEWAESRKEVVGVAVVGSWARGAERKDSDVDLVVLTPDKAIFTSADDWIEAAIGQPARVVRRAEWGVLTERRVRLSSDLEVEFGFVAPSWACVDPIDPGTEEVVKDEGLLPVYDPQGLLGRLAGGAP
jgi:uncharacterized protein